MEEDRKENVQPHSLGSEEPQDEGVTPGELMGIGPTTSLEGELDALKAEAEESSRENNEYKEILQKVQADFMNYKRRAEEERGEQQKYAGSRLILKILPVVDDFNLAIDHASKLHSEDAEGSGAGGSWLEGINLIHRKLCSLLESENVTRIEVEGREFDPVEHEAMAYQESDDHQEGQILAVIRDGYKLHSRVIRPALVILAKEPENVKEESTPSTGKETEVA